MSECILSRVSQSVNSKQHSDLQSDGRRNDSNEKEERDSDGLCVEVCHFLDPPSTNGTLKVSDDSSTKRLGSSVVSAAAARGFVINGSPAAITHSSGIVSCIGLSVAESWHGVSSNN